MALKDIEKRLYGMEEEPEEEKKVFERPEIPEEMTAWVRKPKPIGRLEKIEKEEELKRPPKYYYKKRKKPFLLYAFIGILVGVLIWQGISISQKFFAKDSNIVLNFDVSEEVLVADVFDLRVEYRNDSPDLLQNAILVLELPQDVQSLVDEPEGIFIRRVLGDLGTGSDSVQQFKLVSNGEQGSVLNFKAYLQYSLPGFSSRFEKMISQDINISGSSVSFNLVLPQSIVSNDEFIFQIEYFNNTNHKLPNLKAVVSYPLGFEFISSNIEPEESKNTWIIEDVPAKGEGVIKIIGRVSGQAGSFFDFSTDLSLIENNQVINLGKKSAGLSIFDSPLRLKIGLSSAPLDHIAKLSETLEYDIEYFNNTEVGLEEAIIKVSLEGEMFDLSSVKTTGYFDSGTKRVIWNAGNTEELRLINRGQGGIVKFQIDLKDQYPIKRMNDKDFFLKIRAELESPTIPSGVDLEKTIAIAEHQIKVSGKADLITKALFRDAPSGIVNKGTLPLTVGKATNFTIHWKIINYSTDIKDVVLISTLSQGVSWTGQISGNYGEEPEYNERTGEIIWRIPNIPATSGVVLPANELIFQISAIPSLNQVDDFMNLIEETTFSAIDDFTGKEIKFSVSEIDSSLKDDSTVESGEGRVKK
jgi:hypothetical protein